MKLYDYFDVLNNINHDIIDRWDELDGKMSVDDLLVTIAIPCTRLDYIHTPIDKRKRVMNEINQFIKMKKMRVELYDKDEIRNKLEQEWAPTYSEAYRMRLVFKEFNIVTDTLSDDGFVLLNSKIVDPLRNGRYTKIDYNPATRNTAQKTSIKVIGTGPVVVYHVQHVDGFTQLELNISADQWYKIVQGATENAKLFLALMLSMPNHAASCLQLEKKYGISFNSSNAINTKLADRAVKMMGNISIEDEERPGVDRRWLVTMSRGHYEGQEFIWELRPELAEAALKLQKEGKLMTLEEAIEKIEDDTKMTIDDKNEEILQPFIDWYVKNWDYMHVTPVVDSNDPDPFMRTREGYKWAATKDFQEAYQKHGLQVDLLLKEGSKRAGNLLAGSYYFPRATMLKEYSLSPEPVKEAFAGLYDESIPLIVRVYRFLQDIKNIHEENKKLHPEVFNAYDTDQQSPRSISVYLAFRYPDKHFLYKHSLFRDLELITDIKVSGLGNDSVLMYVRYEYFCNWLRTILLKNDSLVQKVKSTYPDDPSNFHLVTQDFLYAIAAHKPYIEGQVPSAEE
jgi:hypothetical protein